MPPNLMPSQLIHQIWIRNPERYKLNPYITLQDYLLKVALLTTIICKQVLNMVCFGDTHLDKSSKNVIDLRP